ncbi:MAG: hypothetical protein Ct9H90mP7_5650 [Candidatus Neomarinimicrobiota bacterium]|nr:MAG: hypothetical protein Ct9H90mP7_5650 [Candidatus Neomarinimicrobiota bacterium]
MNTWSKFRGEAKAKGYVETVMGRRVHVPEINSGNGLRRQAQKEQLLTDHYRALQQTSLKKGYDRCISLDKRNRLK